MKHIDSLQNPLIKRIEQLQRKSKSRRLENAFVVEGKREVALCDQGSFVIQSLIICPAIFNCETTVTAQEVDRNLKLNQQPEIITVSTTVYEKIAYRTTTEGCMAIVTSKNATLESLQLGDNPLLLVAESIEKPGNIGALLRTADAAAVDAVILTNALSDVYNPNVIRASIGCVFTVPIAVCTTAQLVNYLQDKQINLFAATLQASKPYYQTNFTGPTAIAVGTEATGLTNEMRQAATANIIIPMQGAIDSMNVSVSASILIFEAKRQRGF